MVLFSVSRNVQSLVEQGQKGELTMQPGKSMMESLESSINKVNLGENARFVVVVFFCWTRLVIRDFYFLECVVGLTRAWPTERSEDNSLDTTPCLWLHVFCDDAVVFRAVISRCDMLVVGMI